MSRNNKNREGYIDTKVGWIPEDWDSKSLKDIALIQTSNVDKKSYKNQRKVFLCNYMDVLDNEYIHQGIDFMNATASNEEILKFKLNPNDVLITKDSETREDIANTAVVTDEFDNLICGYHLSILRPKEKNICGTFIAKLLKERRIHHYFVTHANGVTRFGLTLNTLRNATVPIPPLSEQKKIAKILKTWDQAIELEEKQIEAKERLKRGLMQHLLTGKMRFPGFGKPISSWGIPKNWKEVPLSQFFKEKNERNHKNSISLILSCSKLYGIIAQSERFNKRIAAKDISRYKIVQKNDLVYDPMLLWDASIGFVKNYEEGVVSPAYSTFTYIGDKDIFEYFKQLIYSYELRYYYKIISQGTNRRRRKATSNAFLKLKIKLPTNHGELIKIRDTLCELDKEIIMLKKRKEAFQRQKQGLMQKLLTGEVRVKA